MFFDIVLSFYVDGLIDLLVLVCMVIDEEY